MVPLRAVALVMLLLPAAAQAQIPAREGNTWNWRHHQPTRAGIQQRERAAGVALRPSKQRALNRRVKRLGQSLLARQPGPGDPPPEGRQ